MADEALVLTYLKDHSKRLGRIETRLDQYDACIDDVRMSLRELKGKARIKTALIGAAGAVGAGLMNLIHRLGS